MSWKLIAAAVLVFVIVVLAAYRLGGHFATKAAVAQCAVDRQTDKTTYQAAQTEAVELARQAQADADKAALAETQRLLGEARAASVQAQKSASEAQAKADNLHSELTRLRNENPTVSAWNDHCLPPALLRSLHGTEVGPAGSTCR